MLVSRRGLEVERDAKNDGAREVAVEAHVEDGVAGVVALGEVLEPALDEGALVLGRYVLGGLDEDPAVVEEVGYLEVGAQPPHPTGERDLLPQAEVGHLVHRAEVLLPLEDDEVLAELVVGEARAVVEGEGEAAEDGAEGALPVRRRLVVEAELEAGIPVPDEVAGEGEAGAVGGDEDGVAAPAEDAQARREVGVAGDGPPRIRRGHLPEADLDAALVGVVAVAGGEVRPALLGLDGDGPDGIPDVLVVAGEVEDEEVPEVPLDADHVGGGVLRAEVPVAEDVDDRGVVLVEDGVEAAAGLTDLLPLVVEGGPLEEVAEGEVEDGAGIDGV